MSKEIQKVDDEGSGQGGQCTCSIKKIGALPAIANGGYVQTESLKHSQTCRSLSPHGQMVDMMTREPDPFDDDGNWKDVEVQFSRAPEKKASEIETDSRPRNRFGFGSTIMRRCRSGFKAFVTRLKTGFRGERD